MKRINKAWFAILMIALLTGCKKSGAAIPPGAKSSGFRVIGYLPYISLTNGEAANVDFSKINYLNIAFINPDSNGNFSSLAGLNTVVEAAHNKSVKVLASIGGGSAPAYYASLLSDNKRNDFVNQLVQMILSNQLDGIDVDLEGEHIDSNYEPFIAGLSAALKSKNKTLSAAIATIYKSQYSDNALSHLDFINIMSYDKTGPWKPANPGPHAPYDMAVDDLNYWTNTRGIAKEKLSLGVPFYGYGFGQNAPVDMSYRDIISQYPGAENRDQVSVSGGGIIFYNGLSTIKNKTTLALQKAGGIMIWQLLQDAAGNNSLLNIINTTIRSAK